MEVMKPALIQLTNKMETSEYKKFKKEVYEDFIQFARIMRISFRIDRDKVNDLMKKDSTVTLERIRADFAKYPLIQESIIDYKQVVMFPK